MAIDSDYIPTEYNLQKWYAAKDDIALEESLMLTRLFGLLLFLPRMRRGRRYGNRIADQIGIDRNLFHTALEWGGMPMHLHMLAQYAAVNEPLDDAIDAVLPFLESGLYALEASWGEQSQINKARSKLEYFRAITKNNFD